VTAVQYSEKNTAYIKEELFPPSGEKAAEIIWEYEDSILFPICV
jgi:hypothetical protein